MSCAATARPESSELTIILGVVVLVIGFVAKVAIIWTLGIIAVAVGRGASGRPHGGTATLLRRHDAGRTEMLPIRCRS